MTEHVARHAAEDESSDKMGVDEAIDGAFEGADAPTREQLPKHEQYVVDPNRPVFTDEHGGTIAAVIDLGYPDRAGDGGMNQGVRLLAIYDASDRSYTLVSRDASGAEHTKTISTGESIVVGRGGSDFIPANNRYVSREHLRVSVNEHGELALTDLSNTTETFVGLGHFRSNEDVVDVDKKGTESVSTSDAHDEDGGDWLRGHAVLDGGVVRAGSSIGMAGHGSPNSGAVVGDDGVIRASLVRQEASVAGALEPPESKIDAQVYDLQGDIQMLLRFLQEDRDTENAARLLRSRTLSVEDLVGRLQNYDMSMHHIINLTDEVIGRHQGGVGGVSPNVELAERLRNELNNYDFGSEVRRFRGLNEGMSNIRINTGTGPVVRPDELDLIGQAVRNTTTLRDVFDARWASLGRLADNLT